MKTWYRKISREPDELQGYLPRFNTEEREEPRPQTVASPIIDSIETSEEEPRAEKESKPTYTTSANTTSSSFKSKNEFKATMLPIYERILSQMGLNTAYAKALVAQDGLESAWGTKPSGKFNFGGIKGKGSTVPLNMYITPKESSNILNRQNLYSGFVCMNFDDAYLYNSTPDELLSWKEVQTNFWNNTISKTKVTLTLTTTDGDIVSALTMLPIDSKTLMFFFDPRSNIYNQAVESMTFKDEYLGYNLRYEFPSSTSAWTTQIKLNGQFIGLTNTGTLEPVPFRGKYKI